MERPTESGVQSEAVAAAEAAKVCLRNSGWLPKSEEYRMISDLTGFDHLRAMMEGEATVKRKKRERRRRNKKTNHESVCVHFSAQLPAPEHAGNPAIDRQQAGRDEAVRTVEVSKPDLIEISDDEVPRNVAADDDRKMTETAQAVKSRISIGNGDATGSRDVIHISSSSSEDDGFISNVTFRKSTREMVSREATINEDGETAPRKKEMKTVVAEETVDTERIKKQPENAQCAATLKLPKTAPTANFVQQKLLRKPRYFDFPNGWVRCLRCKADHPGGAAYCTRQKRVKPCFLCGSLQHKGKHSVQGLCSFACRRSGDQANGCPNKNQNNGNDIICLRCGNSGHEMFSCTSDYSPDALKTIQCYICKEYGHLCCANLPDTSPTEISCYNCGQCGHLGSECTSFPKFVRGSNDIRVCYRCREEGHFARNCAPSRKHLEFEPR